MLMKLIKQKIFIILLLFLNSCSTANYQSNSNFKGNLTVETQSNRYNLLLKQHIKRGFLYKFSTKRNFILKTEIKFISSDTLSDNGQKSLKSTKAKLNYTLTEVKSDKKHKTIDTGSIITFPALSSSSSSIYSKDKSLRHIKERLCVSSAKKLNMRLILILKKIED